MDSSKILLKTSTRIVRNWRKLAVFSSVAVLPITAVIAMQPALAQQYVTTNNALRLYGNAVNSGLCKTLSPATQNLWVCELTDSDPDVHLTFNGSTPLHITVRSPRGEPKCEGSSRLVGKWPNNLALDQNERSKICGVDVVNYVNRLNSVPEEFQDCVEAFNEAQARGKISASVSNSYIQKCKEYPE